jgi:hypothetical protein
MHAIAETWRTGNYCSGAATSTTADAGRRHSNSLWHFRSPYLSTSTITFPTCSALASLHPPPSPWMRAVFTAPYPPSQSPPHTHTQTHRHTCGHVPQHHHTAPRVGLHSTRHRSLDIHSIRTGACATARLTLPAAAAALVRRLQSCTVSSCL